MDAAKSVTALFASSGTRPTLTVTVTGNGKVTGPGINCGQGNTDCSEVYAGNTTVTLAETPASGATFAGWGGSCSGTAGTCTVVMSASRALTATFTQGSTQKMTLNVTVGGSGHVSGPGISCGTSPMTARTRSTMARPPSCARPPPPVRPSSAGAAPAPARRRRARC